MSSNYSTNLGIETWGLVRFAIFGQTSAQDLGFAIPKFAKKTWGLGVLFFKPQGSIPKFWAESWPIFVLNLGIGFFKINFSIYLYPLRFIDPETMPIKSQVCVCFLVLVLNFSKNEKKLIFGGSPGTRFGINSGGNFLDK